MTLSPVDRLLAVQDCTGLMHEYGYRFDHGEAVAVADLFTADGEWSSPAVACRGRDELIAFFRQRAELTDRVTRHVVTNITVSVQSADLATARSYAVEFRGTRGDAGDATLTGETRPAVIGDYEDEFVRVDGSWKFHRRRVVLEFKRAGEQYLRAR